MFFLCRIHQIQTRWKILLSRVSRFNVQSSKLFLHFDVPSHERKTKADWDARQEPSSGKRQKVASPLKFSNIQRVSKTSLQQQQVAPASEVAVKRSTVSPVHSSLEMTLIESSSVNSQRNYIHVILVTVQENLVRNLLVEIVLLCSTVWYLVHVDRFSKPLLSFWLCIA